MKLFDEFFRQRSDLVEASKTPRTVIFSTEGWRKALKEMEDAGAGYAHNIVHGPSPTYCGLHRCTDDRPNRPDIVVSELTQAEYFAPRPRQRAITVQGTFGKFGGQEPKTMVQLVASSLDAATLCDIIREWLDSDDATHWGEFEKALDEVVTKHGRFE